MCPICRRVPKPREKNPAFPFCSARCRTIDLGKWLNEEYRVPVAQSHEGEIEDEELERAELPPSRH